MSDSNISAPAPQDEIWKPVAGYEGWYEVSNFGRVKRIKPSNSSKLWKSLKPHDVLGYHTVDLCKDGIPCRFLIHILVACAFFGEPPTSNHTQVNHKNGIRWDNRVENLEWVTPSENARHAYKTGLNKNIGENNNLSKLNWEQVREIRKLKKQGAKYYDLASKFNVAFSTIYRVTNNKIWIEKTQN